MPCTSTADRTLPGPWFFPRIVGFLLLGVLATCPARAQAPDLAAQAQAVLQRYCFECHGKDGSKEGGMDYAVDLSRLVQGGKVKPKDLTGSRVMIRLRSKIDPMPPEGAARPDAAAIAAIERWIAAGAPPLPVAAAPSAASRSFVSTSEVIAAIHGHLQRLDAEDRPFQRYLTLTNVHNQPLEKASAAQLASVRAAASKVLNSLSWQFEIVVPKPLDAQQTVLAFDLRDVGWDSDSATGRPDLWLHLVSRYPYALKHDRYPDDKVARQKAEEIYTQTGVDIPWVRADWFAAAASKPPLYHTLLYDAVFAELARRPKSDVKQPDGSTAREPAMTAKDLEGWLRVNVVANLRRNRAVRAGFTKSGVSSQPRMIERHPALYGAYWKSYDFKRGNPTLNLLARPLGPPGTFNDSTFKPFEFKHDGGEIIFNLPNGLQGYLLTDGQDRRINEGPPDVVEDSAKTLGNAVIVNGLSCMACHKQGTRREFEDNVRFGAAGLSSDARDRVRRLYLDPPDMNLLLDKDDRRFQQAVAQCVGPFLHTAPADLPPGETFDEPLGPVAKRFLGEDLGLAELAAELGLEKTDELGSALRTIPALREAGLAAVAQGARLKRETWEAGAGLTLFQKVVLALPPDLRPGTPTSVVPPEN